jgi:hypothetical protein
LTKKLVNVMSYNDEMLKLSPKFLLQCFSLDPSAFSILRSFVCNSKNRAFISDIKLQHINEAKDTINVRKIMNK